MKKTTSMLLAAESADWYHRGLVDATLAQRLGQRYDRRGLALSSLTSWLGLSAIFLLCMAILTMLGLYTRSTLVSGVLLGAASAGLWHAGIKLATHPAQRHPVTGSALVTVGLAAAYGAMLLLTSAGNGEFSGNRIFFFLLMTGLLGLATAYAYSLRWPLLLSLLCVFHGLGAWHEYAGHGAYVASIQDPRSMALAGAACTLFGLWHQHEEEHRLARYVGFGRLYVIFGLLYLNTSLWFMTLIAQGSSSMLVWVLGFSAACIAQIVAGARLKDGKLTGFGIVFLGIDLYTRFFEHFWDRLSMGLFLVIAGLGGVLLGWLFEKRATTSNA